MKNLNEYQEKASEFAVYHHHDYPFLALSEESGEVMGKLAKYVRKHDTTLNNALYQAKDGHTAKAMQLKVDLAQELGDVLWDLAMCATELELSLDDITEMNINKLEARKLVGLLVGEGDNR
jgi:NTP pyrophosphatase (non-canonical NTP hydrolase)